ncbi:PTS sugar transporter subunit IIC [Thomasclavelia ramosa]|uniref:PTS sugar transporter subunit IIC n=1 Tax=Thomasclavelia ramosa TaxID=1547 RepID=UPI0034503A05
MKNIFTKVIDKFGQAAVKFSSIPIIKAVLNGIMMATPFIMVGSIFTLLNNIPWDPYINFLTDTNIADLFNTANRFTMGIIALIVSFTVAYQHVKDKKSEAVAAGIVSACSFLILIPTVALENGSVTIDINALGSSNLFTAIIVAILASMLFDFFVQKGLVIKLPASVPPATMSAFTSLIPAFIVIIIFATINILFKITTFGSFPNMITTLIQTPLLGLGGTVWAIVVFYLLSNAVWFAGIHGNVVMSVVAPVLLALDMENVALVEAGKAATNIVGQNFANVYAGMSGAGITLGLAILMAFVAKSERYKTVGRISVVPGIFCINEPVVFGTPIMFNVTMIIPFISLPIISIFLAYGLTSLGILPVLSGVQLPWSTPCVLLGFLLGGWKVAAYQIFLIILSIVIYYPFFKQLDKAAYIEEQGSEIV